MVALLPWLLIAARAAAALALAVALATGLLTDRMVLWLFVVAFVSDYFDGVIARALKLVTHRLRQADSLVDTVFYVLLAAATWTLHPEVLRRGPWLVVACVVGTLSHLEGIAISLILRHHAADVPTVLHALRDRTR